MIFQNQNAVKIKSLYLTNNSRYLTSNTTRVVLQHYISIVISTKYFYIEELVQMPVLTAHYGEPQYKTCLYGDFLNLYGGGWGNSILATGISAPQLR
jgi:hypothetical protein